VVRRDPTPRCSVCGEPNPVDELIVEIHREAAYRLFVCRRCAQDLEEQEQGEYAA
jgi:predicted metal-binding protein